MWIPIQWFIFFTFASNLGSSPWSWFWSGTEDSSTRYKITNTKAICGGATAKMLQA